MITISTGLNEARLAGVRDFLDSGAGAATVNVYDGARPAGGAAVTTQNLLTTITLPEPCGVVAANKLTLDPVPDALIVHTGDATWARILNGNGDYALGCDVTDTLGAGEIKLASTSLLIGGAARLVSGQFT